MNRRKIILLSVSLVLSLSMFAQKSEVKAAEKALKKKDYAGALAAISQAESLIGSADAKLQAKYYYVQGMALYAEGNNSGKIDEVIVSFNTLKEIEEKSGSSKYSNEAATIVSTIVEKINADAFTAYETATKTNSNESYLESADGYRKIYMLSPVDTSYLYNSAMINGKGKAYEKSNAQYLELLDLGYTGIGTVYSATSTINGETRTYNSKKDMDREVSMKMAENPETKVIESKYITIIKAVAGNYLGLENNEKAMEFIQKARKENPKDYNLIIEEGNIYFRMGNSEKFLEKLEEAISINPTNPQLFYNVGILNSELGNNEDAIKKIEKAIELDPDYGDAYNAIGNIILKEVEAVQEEMDKNSMNFSKYDKIKEEKLMPILSKALPYIEKAYELNNEEVVRKQLNSIYENLGMDKRVD